MSKLPSRREFALPVAQRSHWVRAPRRASRLATADAKRFSSPTSLMRNLYCGPLLWLERWMALSADHGSSSVMWKRRLWFLTPVEAASERIAINLPSFWKWFFSWRSWKDWEVRKVGGLKKAVHFYLAYLNVDLVHPSFTFPLFIDNLHLVFKRIIALDLASLLAG